VLECYDARRRMTHLPTNTGNRFAGNDQASVHARGALAFPGPLQ